MTTDRLEQDLREREAPTRVLAPERSRGPREGRRWITRPEAYAVLALAIIGSSDGAMDVVAWVIAIPAVIAVGWVVARWALSVKDR